MIHFDVAYLNWWGLEKGIVLENSWSSLHYVTQLNN